MSHPKGVSPEKGPPDWVMLDGQADDHESRDSEVNALRVQADVYREDFVREHGLRRAAEEDGKRLKEEIVALRDQLSKKDEEMDTQSDEAIAADDEKRALLLKLQDKETEIRLLQQQVQGLQYRLRQFEAKERDTFLQQRGLIAPATKWACSLCTFDNKAEAEKCEICHEPAPSRRLDISTRKDFIVCD